ncbi:MAG: SDR family oxidoreductase [Candidatus Omnitrophica bacterium]|nr:SDR family oxidoreductase [Candidatus Omnitrophota bacterium]MCF7893994.1 SDR family oxidoreductase [Candidatus Omnitrophota bacterium]
MEELKDKKVLVTGGAGFIGSHIVDRLIELGAEVTVLDNLITGKLENIKDNLDKIKFIEKSLTDDLALEESLEGIDLICHQAALRSVPKSVESPFEFHEVNVTGTLKLFLKAKEKGIKKIVFASSSSVYGERFDFPEKETDSPKPVSPYAATKLMDEHYGSLFSQLYGVDVVSLRYFNVFGPRQSLENRYAVVVPKFITSLLSDESPPIYGDGQQERDFTYIDNVVEANILALTKDDIGGEVFNIAGGAPYSVNQLYKLLKDLTKKDLKPDYLKPRPGDVRKTFADISKAIKGLDWQPKINFKEGLEKTVDYFRLRLKDKG